MTTEIEGGLLDWDERNAGAASYVRISNVSKAYDTGDNPAFALQDISLDIIAGEFLSVVGPSGCGKSTLLKCIAGLQSVTAGRITVKGTHVLDTARQHGGCFSARRAAGLAIGSRQRSSDGGIPWLEASGL